MHTSDPPLCRPPQVLERSDSLRLAATLAAPPSSTPIDFRFKPFVALVSNFANALIDHSIQAGTMGMVRATRAKKLALISRRSVASLPLPLTLLALRGGGRAQRPFMHLCET